MSTYKVAVIGDKDSILGFKAVGFDTFPVAGAEAALAALKQVVVQSYAVVLLTEELARELEEPLAEISTRFLPAVVLIPDNKGSTGLGRQMIKQNVEKAIGADILSGKEG